MCSRPAPESERERRGADTRAEPATPRARGLHGGREGGSDLLSPPPQRQPRRLDQRFGPLPAQSTAGGSDAGTGKELGLRQQDLVPPGHHQADPPPPRPWRGCPAYPSWSRCGP